jgi:hypothetical protein
MGGVMTKMRNSFPPSIVSIILIGLLAGGLIGEMTRISHSSERIRVTV